MADNLTTQSTTPATVPASTQIATDEVASVHYQRVKLVDGTADSTTAIPGDATNGLDVDVTRVQGTVTVGDGGNTLSVDDGGSSLTVDGTVSVGNFPATQPVSGTVTVQDGGGSLTVDGTLAVSSVAGTVAVSGPLTDAALRASDVDVNVTNASFPVTGTFWQATQPISGSVSISGTPTVSLSGTNTVTQTPATSGGLTSVQTISAAASTNTTTIKASAGQLYGVIIGNSNGSPRYVKFYNGSPTVGTTTPLMTVLVPGNTSGAGVVASFDSGVAFASGIYLAITTGVAVSDTGTTSGTEVVVNSLYK